MDTWNRSSERRILLEIKFLKFLPKKNQWMILLLIGVLLLVIALPTDRDSGSDSGTNILSGSNKTDSSSYSTETEQKLKHLLSQMEGVGEVHVMITYQKEDKVQGIVILAEGGGDAVVVRNITGVVQALFDVDSHKIRVIEKNQNK